VSRGKVERLVNLTIALMATGQPLTVDRIGALVDGYDPGDGEAFRRMFERDKEELRELGIPLEVEQTGDGEPGYRIPRRDYALPELRLDADEAAALGLAARFWSSATLAAAGRSALRKLAADGVDAEPPPDLSVQVDASEPSFPAMLTAALERREVHFGYRRPGDEAPVPRRVQPWGVVSWHGRWYLCGQDLDRAAARVFRLSRVTGEVTSGPGGAFPRPGGVDLRALVEATDQAQPGGTALLRLAPGTGHALRRQVGAGPGDAEIRLPFADLDRTADRLVGFGPDVVVVEPVELRSAVVARLRAALA
jgi:proteasome accessory factor B